MDTSELDMEKFPEVQAMLEKSPKSPTAEEHVVNGNGDAAGSSKDQDGNAGDCNTDPEVQAIFEKMDVTQAMLNSLNGRSDAWSVQCRAKLTAELSQLRIQRTLKKSLTVQKQVLERLMVSRASILEEAETKMEEAIQAKNDAQLALDSSVQQLREIHKKIVVEDQNRIAAKQAEVVTQPAPMAAITNVKLMATLLPPDAANAFVKCLEIIEAQFGKNGMSPKSEDVHMESDVAESISSSAPSTPSMSADSIAPSSPMSPSPPGAYVVADTQTSAMAMNIMDSKRAKILQADSPVCARGRPIRARSMDSAQSVASAELRSRSHSRLRGKQTAPLHHSNQGGGAVLTESTKENCAPGAPCSPNASQDPYQSFSPSGSGDCCKT